MRQTSVRNPGVASQPARMDQATDAIVHELKQPLTSILLTAQAGVRMIDSRASKDVLGEIRALLMEIIDIDKRAGAYMQELRLGG